MRRPWVGGRSTGCRRGAGMHITKDPQSRELHTIVVVAFDRVTGEVRGTYAHSFYGAADEATVRRGTLRLVSDLAAAEGEEILDSIEVAAEQLRDRVIERVDLHSRTVVT